MQQTFSVEFIKENSGCYMDAEGKLKEVFLSNGKTCFEEAGECQITLEEIMSSNIPTKDKYWFLVNNVLDLEERKELFLLVMTAVNEATEDITRKEFINTLIRYANKEVDYDTLDESYRNPPRVGWVFSYYYYDFCSFGLYQIYNLLAWLDIDETTRDLVWEIVNEYVNK